MNMTETCILDAFMAGVLSLEVALDKLNELLASGTVYAPRVELIIARIQWM